MTPFHLIITQTIILGLALGSFYNVCIFRIPRTLSLGGRSYCPHCKKKISWYENIPVLSFIFLGGRCHQCRLKISFRYPLVEILTAALSVLTLYHTNFDFFDYLVWFLFFIGPLIIISFIDMDHQIIPDIISLPAIPIGILVSLYSVWPNWQDALTQSLLGILCGGGSLLLISQLYYWIRKREGMGGGDIKLAAMLGAFLGWKAIVFVFLISSILALIYAIVNSMISPKNSEPAIIPYGPFLSMAALIYYYYGIEIIGFYFSLVGITYN